MTPVQKESWRDLITIFALIVIIGLAGYLLFWLPLHW